LLYSEERGKTVVDSNILEERNIEKRKERKSDFSARKEELDREKKNE